MPCRSLDNLGAAALLSDYAFSKRRDGSSARNTTDNGSLRRAKTAEINHTDYYDVLPVSDSHGFHPGDVEADTIRLYPEVKRQQIHGFGGAFTESAAYVFATAPEETKAAILDGYFGKNGIGYNYGRVSIGGLSLIHI